MRQVIIGLGGARRACFFVSKIYQGQRLGRSEFHSVLGNLLNQLNPRLIFRKLSLEI